MKLNDVSIPVVSSRSAKLKKLSYRIKVLRKKKIIYMKEKEEKVNIHGSVNHI